VWTFFVPDEFCVWVTILRMCLVLRWGAQFVDVPTCLALQTSLAFAVQTYVGARNLRTCLVLRSYPSSSLSFSLVLPCVDVFVADEFCIWTTNLQKCLSFRWGAQLADVQTCLAFALRTCAGARNLRTCLALHWESQLVDVPCVTLGRPTCGRALCCVWAPILRTCLALRWGTQPW
jgi:hypothetical protein